MKNPLTSAGQAIQLALQLDFFSDFLVPDQFKAQPKISKPNPPAKSDIPDAPATETPANVDPRTGPKSFVNNTNKRQTLLQNCLIEYEFLRSKRRSIGFVIGESGLRITAPRWVTLADVEQAIQEKQHWILRKLNERRDLASQRAQFEVRWEDGARFPLLGKNIQLRINNLQNVGIAFAEESGELTVCLPHDASEQQLKDRVQGWLQQKAKEVFLQRLPVFAEKLGVTYHSMSLSSANSRWGSCNSLGKIRLNWRLIHFAPEIIDYVIAHELAHLKEMNHGPQFWAAVQSVFPDFENAKQSLKQHAAQGLPNF
ncbi:MAG: M48 family metallopeptidase [Burkholderiaceae bacterium]|nr:M48 family metallopeptidase [Burkholderiaceae bacterium]